MEWDHKDYRNFLDSVLLFRTVRDTDISPEIWVDRWLDSLENSKDHSPEVRQHMILATKVAELIDDRKAWLLEEIDADLKEAWTEMPKAA